MSLRERFAALSHVQIGVIAAVVLAVVLVSMLGGLYRKPFAPSQSTVEAVFADVGQLSTGNAVRVRGVDVGTVTRISPHEGGRSALVKMKVEGRGLPLHDDATAAVRWRTALGASFVVEIDPGTPGGGELAAARIPIERTTSQPELDHITTAASKRARRGLRELIGELAPSFRDRAAPARAFQALADAAPNLEAAARALRGNRSGRDIRRLITSGARAMNALSEPRQPIRELVEGAAGTVAATARRQADVRATLRIAPAALDVTLTTLARLSPTLELADSLLDRIEPPIADLRPTTEALRPVLADADELLSEATPLLRALRPAARDLARTARIGVPLLDELRPSLRRVARNLLPYLARVDSVSRRPTYQMIGPTFAGFTGASGQFDAAGHMFRFPAVFGPNTFTASPCKEFITDPSNDQLLFCEDLLDYFQRIAEGIEVGG